jgi:hypothetical protein
LNSSKNKNTINENNKSNSSALKIVDDSEEQKNNNENEDYELDNNEDKQSKNKEKTTLPPLKNEKSLLKKFSSLENKEPVKYFEKKLNFINVVKVNNPKFSSNFGKFHIHNNIVVDKLKKSYNDGLPNPSKSLTIPKNIYSKYEYLNFIGPEDKSQNKLKIYNANQKLVKNKVNTVRSSKLSPIKNYTENKKMIETADNKLLDQNVNEILDMNLNTDYSKTNDEDYNNLLYKKGILIDSLEKTDQLILTSNLLNDKKQASFEHELQENKKKLSLIFEENNLYHQEINDLSELIRLYYEDLVENNNRKSTLISTTNVNKDDIPRDMSLTNIDILNEMNYGNNTINKNSNNSSFNMENNLNNSQEKSYHAFITSGGKNSKKKVNNILSIVNEGWSKIAETNQELTNVSKVI